MLSRQRYQVFEVVADMVGSQQLVVLVGGQPTAAVAVQPIVVQERR